MIKGGAGTNTIDGGPGTDAVVFSSSLANYQIAYFTAAQTFAVADLRSSQPDGVDGIAKVERFQFTDGIINTATLRPDFSEYVAVNNATVAAGGNVSIDVYAMNLGNVGSGDSSTANIYLSTDATITTADTVLATINSGALTSVGQPGYYDHQTLSVTLAANLAPGTYYIGGIADTNNQVSESNEGNNNYNVTKITVTAPVQPDLSEYVSVANTTIAAGGSTTIDAYAMNVGSGAAGASTGKIYLSTDATITTADTVLATINSGALTSVGQPGYYDHQTLSVTLAANLAPGTYYIGGIADTNNQVSESNEGNNNYNVTKITVTAPVQPDLSEYVSVANTTIAAGGSTTIDAYAMNVGSGAAGASTGKIYLSTDATITTADTVLATINSGALTSVGQPGYYDHQTLSVTLAANLAPGTYYIGGIADTNNQVSESNEGNNNYNVTKITVTAPVQPDLSEYVSVANTTIAAGGSTTIDAYAMNVGSGAAGASTGKIYLSTDATITTADTVLATINSGALTSVGQPGYYDHQTLSVTLAANLAPGTYYIGGIADTNNQVSESNEGNNNYNVTKITVTAPVQPDLSEYVSVANTTIAAGGSTTIDAYAMNVGSGAAGASTGKIYLSTDATITTADTVLATINSGALTSVGQPGYYDHQTLSVTLAANLAPGTYYIGGIADTNNQVSESNEGNNNYNVTKITVTAPVQPDLSEYVSVANTTIAAGGSTTIDAYAMNVGSGAAGASTGKIYLSTDATITTADTVLATINSGALTSVGQPGYYDHQTLSVTLAANLAPGTYYIGGIADTNNQVSESNEGNNNYNVTKVAVTAPAPSAITLNDVTMWSAGALSLVNTFVGNGGTVSYYAPLNYDGFTISNLDRTDFALSSIDSGFATSNSYSFDGSHVLEVPAGGTVPTADTLRIVQQSGAPFSAQSIDLDTLFATNGQTASFTGTRFDNSVVTQTFSLDSTQGMQTFHFDSTFTGLKSLDFAPSMNEYFDNITIATSVAGTSAPATIGAGATLEINTAFSAQVTFAAGSGLLKLDIPSSFTGQVAGISGSGDVIDFAGFDPNTTSASYSAGSGNLTVNDATHTVSIKLVGDYSHSIFTVSTDNHEGTLVADPPAVLQVSAGDSPLPASDIVESTAPNQTLLGGGGRDSFVFKLGFGQATVANFQPGTDSIEIDKSWFSSPDALLAATHDDGHGNAVIVADQSNTITLTNVAAFQVAQHLADIHLI